MKTHTPEQLQTQAAFSAWQLGQDIEFRHSRYRGTASEWDAIKHAQQNCSWLPECDYRPAPKPKTRPWNCAADVPGPVCWIRCPSHRPDFSTLISSVSDRGITYHSDDDVFIPWTDTGKWERCEYSTDRLNWKPCTVEVTE